MFLYLVTPLDLARTFLGLTAVDEPFITLGGGFLLTSGELKRGGS